MVSSRGLGDVYKRQFPDGIALGATLGPEFSTEVVAAAGGREQRDTPLKYPKITGDISPGVKTQAQFKALRAFFYVARGRLHGWRIRDMADYTFAHSGTEIGIVILITGTTYQLHKRYVSGAQTFDRKITKPVTGTLEAVSYTHLTLPTIHVECRSRWSPYH